MRRQTGSIAKPNVERPDSGRGFTNATFTTGSAREGPFNQTVSPVVLLTLEQPSYRYRLAGPVVEGWMV